ncbi:hypothetical protein GQ42DRAFT_163798 [Ramicandelaber brevisporus]|nr:hypothetical protein GQ42DRAFT_163798 [Ramicandelaber brevisporus]
MSEPTRSMAIERYGKNVRCIDLDVWFCNAIKRYTKCNNVCDILSVFSSVNILSIRDNDNLLVRNGIQYKDILMCFPHLYKIDCQVFTDMESYDLVTLALAINHRNNNRNMTPIEYIKLFYFIRNADNLWTRLSNFVQMILSNSVMKIRITTRYTTSILPSPSELQILSNYLTSRPDMAEHEDKNFCYAAPNSSLFWKPVTSVHSSSLPQPRQLSLQTCCRSSDTYDYNEITPVNFPFLQSIEINGHECNNMISHSYPPAWKMVLLQIWPQLYDLSISINVTCDQLVNILEYHHSLTILGIELQPNMLDKDNTFNLANILPLLPKLQQLNINGKNGIKLDHCPGYNGFETITRSQLNLTSFIGVDLSSRMLKFLYSLPNLATVNIRWCKFYSTSINEVTNIDNLTNDLNEIDMLEDDDEEDDDDGDNIYEELTAILNTISMTFLFNNPCGIKRFDLYIRRGDYDWPLDFTLEMIALMPILRNFDFVGVTNEIPKAVKTRFPYINIAHYS